MIEVKELTRIRQEQYEKGKELAAIRLCAIALKTLLSMAEGPYTGSEIRAQILKDKDRMQCLIKDSKI